MDSLIIILEIIIPCGIVFASCYFLVKNFLDAENRKNELHGRSANSQIITPLRLQAYERMALFLERISPNSLVMRIHKSGMSSRLLHAELLKAIRSEFEHNLSQQIYISSNAWEMIKNAKEETIKLVNLSASRLSDTAQGSELCQFIIEAGSHIKKLPTQSALDYLKKEIAQSF